MKKYLNTFCKRYSFQSFLSHTFNSTMAMIKLPNKIQSLFCSSTQINSYKRAIEELVCNSLDAESTSIAVRIDIDQNAIQVIDNGCGMAISDFTLLGQRYATSKCIDMSTLKCAPNKYGSRGESLASIIEVSKSVKITSRNENTEETWMKAYHKGKEHNLCKTALRPSQGTTVEIKGFLYNLNIQKKAINTLEEINDIKIYLEQLSLVHSNISISLRDDAKNEIIFKLHKNRDIYQTLLSIFGIQSVDVQELKVEKNEYKVTAIIGKKDRDISQSHWIYLNRKFIRSSNLHKIINDSFTKLLGLKYQTKRKCKSKNDYNDNETNNLLNNNIPFYFIFITCPYCDYDISNTAKRSILEFKNWDPIDNLLQKLVKFYIGDLDLKAVSKINKNQDKNKAEDNTRNQVKKLIEKILGSNSKKPGISQMHKGIKGKLIKRKIKQKKTKPLSNVTSLKDNDEDAHMTHNHKDGQRSPEENVLHSERNTKKKTVNISISKIIPLKATTSHHHYEAQKSIKHNDLLGSVVVTPNLNRDLNFVSNVMRTKTTKKLGKTKISHANVHRKVKKTLLRDHNFLKPNGILDQVFTKSNERKGQKVAKSSKPDKTNNEKKKSNKTVCTTKKLKDATETSKNEYLIHPLIMNFETRDSVKRRCNMLAKRVDELMSYKKKRNRQIFINELIQYTNVVRSNKNVCIRKKFGEIVIDDYVPLPPILDRIRKETCKSSYDLVRTILKSQQEEVSDKVNYFEEATPANQFNLRTKFSKTQDIENDQLLPKLTFESHNYQNQNNLSQNPTSNNKIAYGRKDTNIHFITKQSRDNFIVPQDICFRRNSKQFNLKTKPFNKRATVFDFHTNHGKVQNLFESSNTIEFSQNNRNDVQQKVHSNTVTDYLPTYNIESTYGPIGMTYTVDKDDEHVPDICKICSTYTVLSDSFRMLSDNDIQNECWKNANCYESQRTNYTRESNNKLCHLSQIENKGCASHENLLTSNIMNDVFVAEEDNNEMSVDISLDPINVCEAELRNLELCNGELAFNKQRQNESWCNDIFDVGSLICDRNAYIQTPQALFHGMDIHNVVDNFSHHFEDFQDRDYLFNQPIDNILLENNDNIRSSTITAKGINLNQNNASVIEPSLERNDCSKDLQLHSDGKQTKANDFVFRNRLRFIPKGMSQIFENCQSKTVCNYSFQEEYFKGTIYNNFADDVQVNSKIFEPRIQNVKELVSKDIEKVNIRLNKENASLKFTNESLKQVSILGQVDDKFIAAKIKGRSGHMNNIAEYLVLFDQHAVHERIRLESNLSDYLNKEKWKSVTLDDITLKLTQDAVLYLHNYKDKFAQFGLQWTFLNNSEITVTGIPEAILGKHPRKVELVMKAVKNLIAEEIIAMKSQRGCISLYPKTIMDLVFSEACRYAIKFGDKLSRTDCVNLLGSLSECKTPFQCAHGRPVMAVVIELESSKHEYKIKQSKVYQFMKSVKKT